MAKGGNSLSSKRSRNAKPYDANNSFVKKVATKVTDLIPQRSWISKWFNSSQDNGAMLNESETAEDSEENEQEEPAQPPPTKRPRIRMDVTHPPGTFNIQPRSRTSADEVDPRKEQYPVHNETNDDFLEPPVTGISGTRRLIASTPAIQQEIRTTNSQRTRSEFISLTSTQNNGTANGTDDNSESSESTSGCSSLIPQVNRQEAPSSLGYSKSFTTNRKRYNDDKLNFTNHLQSPRSLFLDSNPRDSLSSRRPSFNASVMNNSLERGPSYASPFYNGNTTFGGANTAVFQRRGRTLFNSTNELQLKVPNRTNIQVKSPNAAGVDSSGMSQTAKRILETLEHFSSPILDAKKIPMNSNNNLSLIGGRKRQRNESGVPLARVGLRHLTRELTVPTVPDLLKLKRRQRLQDTTVAARKIVSARSAPPPSPQEYRLRSEDEKSKYAGKIKATNKTDFEDNIVVDSVKLSNVTLPISTLPTFDIMLPANKSNGTKRGVKEELYKFASPIKVTDTTRNLKSINNFTFSKPIDANDKDSGDDSHTLSKTLSLDSNASSLNTFSGSNFIWSNTSTAPKLKEKFKEKSPPVDGVKVSNSLKTGSVMDILGKKSDPLMDAWKPAVGMWECSQCLIRNAKDVAQCVACKASKSVQKVDKSNEKSHTSSSAVTVSQPKPVVADCFGSQFKMSSSEWECDVCLVRNKQTDIKCVSCTTPRTGGVKSGPINSTSNIPTFGKSDLMEKFKPVAGSWECPGCLLRNSSAVETCPCCNASKPGSLKISPKKGPATSGSVNATDDNVVDKSKSTEDSISFPCPLKSDFTTGFGDKFKRPAGVWNCDDCMLQNNSETSECIACGAVKPGSKKITKSASTTNNNSGVKFSFGIPENAGGGFKFGIDKGEEKTEVSETNNSTGGFVFGAQTEAPKVGAFSFGVPQNSSGFSFGVTDTKTDKSPVKTEPKEKVEIENVSKKRSLNNEEPKAPPTFSFGVPKTEETKPTAEKTFAFGAPTSTGSSIIFGGFKTDPCPAKANELPKVSFGISNTESPKPNFASSNGEKSSAVLGTHQTSLVAAKSIDNNDIKPTVNSVFGTTNSPATITPTAATVTTPSLFTFGTTTTIQSQSDTSSVQSFGQNPVAAPTAPASSLFVFGSNKSTTLAPPEKSPLVSFGGNNGPAFGGSNATPVFNTNENKSVPAFGVAENKITPLFGATETKTPVFGATETKTPVFGATETKTPIFGAQDSKTTAFGNAKTTTTEFSSPAAAAPTFGITSSIPAFSTLQQQQPAFGNSGSPWNRNDSTNMFAATKPADNPPAPASSGIFTFAGNSAQPPLPQSTAGFNFSNNNPVPTPASAPAQKSLFSFGSTSTTQQPGAGFGGATNFNSSTAADSTPSSFAFNSPKPEAPAFGQPTPMFGAPQNTPSFGQNQATSAFGNSAPAPSSGLNFGNAVAAAPSGFNFGVAAPAAAPPSGGFTFNAPSQNPSTAFDPNTPPTFNFTGGSAPAIFNATPQAAQQRKFKKAVRRTQQR